jgi:hypothetical protein
MKDVRLIFNVPRRSQPKVRWAFSLPSRPFAAHWSASAYLVGEVVEDVAVLLGEAVAPGEVRGPLLVAEDQVDPAVQVPADVVALQRLAVQADELLRAALGPGGQDHVVDALTVGCKRGERQRSGQDVV